MTIMTNVMNREGKAPAEPKFRLYAFRGLGSAEASPSLDSAFFGLFT